VIADRLVDEILRGAYRAGERLPAERDLAEQLSANRSSVREALRRLEQLGLVVVRRGGGATVCSTRDARLRIVRPLLSASGRLDRELALQVLDVHEMLVCGAARLCAERADDDQILHARELLARLAAPGLGRDEFGAVLDSLFEVVTESSGNLVLRLARNELRPVLADELRPLFWRAMRPPDDALLAALRRIDLALAARDAAAAEEGVRALLRGRRPRLLDALAPLAGSTTP
jgi:DNA-binding FadR family transcriptional regulator